MQELTVKIKALNRYGYGVSFHEGDKLLIPFVLVGETVRVRKTHAHKDSVYCEVVEILERRAARAKPVCPYFGACGGCDFQHMSYTEQLAFKKGVFEKLFADTVVHDVLASPKAYHYRNRITLHKDKNQVGFKRKASEELIEIQSCAIASEALNEKLKTLSARDFGKKKDLELREDHLQQAFIQVNTQQNENLKKLVLSHLQRNKRDRLLELYCGSGNFTFDAAPLVKSVVAVEGSPVSIQAAQEKAKTLAAQRIQWLCAAVDQAVSQLLSQYEKFDVVLCDPPREGLKSVAKILPRFDLKKIIYVSCHPQTLKRDVMELIQKGFVLSEIQPIDMFPQTHHVEAVAILERKNT